MFCTNAHANRMYYYYYYHYSINLPKSYKENIDVDYFITTMFRSVLVLKIISQKYIYLNPLICLITGLFFNALRKSTFTPRNQELTSAELGLRSAESKPFLSRFLEGLHNTVQAVVVENALWFKLSCSRACAFAHVCVCYNPWLKLESHHSWIVIIQMLNLGE